MYISVKLFLFHKTWYKILYWIKNLKKNENVFCQCDIQFFVLWRSVLFHDWKLACCIHIDVHVIYMYGVLCGSLDHLALILQLHVVKRFSIFVFVCAWYLSILINLFHKINSIYCYLLKYVMCICLYQIKEHIIYILNYDMTD